MKRLHNRELISKLMKNSKFKSEYEAIGPEFELLEKMLKARALSGLSQAEVAKKMRTTTSVVGRLETTNAKKQPSPSLRTLERYASALGCKLKIDFVPKKKSA